MWSDGRAVSPAQCTYKDARRMSRDVQHSHNLKDEEHIFNTLLLCLIPAEMSSLMYA